MAQFLTPEIQLRYGPFVAWGTSSGLSCELTQILYLPVATMYVHYRYREPWCGQGKFVWNRSSRFLNSRPNATKRIGGMKIRIDSHNSERAAGEGKLGRGTVARRGSTPTTTIRLDPEDIAKARFYAEQKGLKYQTYLKMLIHQALQQEEFQGDSSVQRGEKDPAKSPKASRSQRSGLATKTVKKKRD
jgi:hypothetical protein